MSEYYIRTPDHDESRGPFDIAKLETLAEADQINPNTLYYDDTKEEWLPLALNEVLRAQVFPEREKLSLKIAPKKAPKEVPEEGEDPQPTHDVESMLAAAEGKTDEKRTLTRQKESFERAVALSAVSLGIMMAFSALSLFLPLTSEILNAINGANFVSVLNYPVVLIGIFDLVLALLLLLSVTEVFPLVRGRAMLTLGFGVYVGWAIGDPLLVGLTAAAGLGLFLATIARSLPVMIVALILGIGGNGCLAYLAINGRFDDFFNSIILNLV
jgi:hypothetical protein